MKSETKKRLMITFTGMVLATFVSVFVTFAFFDYANPYSFIRNLVITNAVFIILNLIWIKLHKRYGDMYKSGVELEEDK